jgi:hypothetical protein
MCSFSLTKKCTKCQTNKSLVDFARKGVKQDGSIKHGSWCKSCKSQVDSRRYKKSRKDISMKPIKTKAPVFFYDFSVADEGAGLRGVIEWTRSLEQKSKEEIIP